MCVLGIDEPSWQKVMKSAVARQPTFPGNGERRCAKGKSRPAEPGGWTFQLEAMG